MKILYIIDIILLTFLSGLLAGCVFTLSNVATLAIILGIVFLLFGMIYSLVIRLLEIHK